MKRIPSAAHLRLAVVSLAIVLTLPAAKAADTSAYVYGSSGSATTTFGDADVSVGFSFTAVSDVYVTALGFFDQGDLGLATAHQVGLYSLGGSLLGTTTVQSGTGTSSFVDGYRYESIAPLLLSAGTSYVLAALTTGADGYESLRESRGDTMTVNPAISVASIASLYRYGSSLQFPIENFAGGDYRIYASQNMLLSPVPEPGTLALMLAGVGLIGTAARRRRLA